MKHRVLILGIASPVLAFALYVVTYNVLTARSTDTQQDWRFRLTVSTAVMAIPFLVTLILALKDRAKNALTLSGKTGLLLSVLSLALMWQPIHDGVLRSRQVRNMAMRDVVAPAFETPDLSGVTQRLADQKGKVVLVNIWATWCGPCRDEMPKLDALYKEKKDQGLVIFGISDESVTTQQKFLKEIPVSYPLLTVNGQVPGLYRDIAQYPALFLIDRQGRLQPVPAATQPFEKIAAAVDALVKSGS